MKRLLVLLVLILFITPYWVNAQEADEDRIDTLEKKIEELNKRLDEMEESNEEDFRALLEGQLSIYDQMKKKTHVGGYMNGGFEDFEDRDPEFSFQRFSIVLAAQPHEYAKIIADIGFEYEDGEKEALVKINKLNISVILNENWGEKFIMRHGIIVVPFGDYNENYKETLRDFADRPLVAMIVVPTTWSDVGSGFSSELLSTEKFSLDYQFYVTNGLTNEISSTNEGLRDARPSLAGDHNAAPAISSKLALKYLDRHQLGISFYTDKYDEHEERSIEGYDIDFKLTFWPIEIRGEGAIFIPEHGVNNLGEPVPDWLWGAYIEVDYHWWTESLEKSMFGRTFKNPTLTFMARYDRVEISTGPRLYKEDRVTVGMNYRPYEAAVVKFQHEWNDGDIMHDGRNGVLLGVALEF